MQSIRRYIGLGSCKRFLHSYHPHSFSSQSLLIANRRIEPWHYTHMYRASRQPFRLFTKGSGTTPTLASLTEKVAAVEAAIVKKPPFCTGRVKLDERSSSLFYKTEGNSAKFISLTSATTEELQSLTNACLPAKFGLGTEDVYDESYRKARKMDTSDFMVGFDPSPVVDVIRQELLDGDAVNADLEVELYKLNVYDKGSFFKAHRDTPRRRDMFASLVIVFPTAHEGGNLLLRHDGEEWAFDSTQVLAGARTPSAAFVAFYSDVEHEVSLVESGHRVTLTYNIYRSQLKPDTEGNQAQPKDTDKSPSIQSPRNPDLSLLKSTITNLLHDPTCLPNGGYLGFGLRFMYPAFGGSSFDLQEMIKHLKGSDSILNQVCSSLSLQTSLRIYSDDKNGLRREFLVSQPVDLSRYGELDNLEEGFSEAGVEYMRVHAYDETRGESSYSPGSQPIVWVSPKTEYVSYETIYLAYGNEASLGNLYGHVCLVAKVGPVGKRETVNVTA